MPDFIPPMTATLSDRPFSDAGWFFEVKWDGYRVEAVLRGGKARLWTRNRGDAARYFPDLASAPATWIDAREAIVDGEVVALDDAGRPSFALLQARAGFQQRQDITVPIVYQVFDLLHLDGRSLLGLPLEARKTILREVLREHPRVRYAGHVEADGEALFASVKAEGLEGVMAKERSSRYEPGRRSRAWLKIKYRPEQEFVVAGWEPGSVAHRDIGSLVLAVYDDEGTIRFAGEVGSGLNARVRQDLLTRMAPIARETSPFASPPRLPRVHWVEPRLVVRVEFAEWTRDDLIRQAAYKGMELDKDPRSVHRERPTSRTDDGSTTAAAAATRAPDPPATEAPDPPAAKAPDPSASKASSKRTRSASGTGPKSGADDPATTASADELAALDALGKAGSWSVGGHDVSLTNLDKVLFPEAGLTKRDLIRYDVSMAPVLLPYLRDRGLTLTRYPNGTSGPHFWEKEVPSHAPTWLARWRYESRIPEDSHTYAVADRAAALAFLANQAAIELHPWTSRTDAPHRPTYALIDIDPGPKTTWPEVLVLARLYRAALGHLGVRGYPKVTGKRGVQVWIPVEPRYSFAETAAWVEALSRAVGATVPELISWEWSVRDRRGRARLDYTQNASNKTLVAPYSVRPVGTAPVSAPISWEELDEPELRPDRWTMTSMPARLAERGDLFAGALVQDQILPSLG
jgi:bifunctional non-homologous end joining protein LigD